MLGFWRNMDDGDKVRLTKMTGILVALLAVFTLLATVSYFFTWKADQSSLSSAVGDISVEVSNMAGKMGYRWADLLVRRWFGLGSLAFVVILFAVSVRLLLHRWRYSMVKTTLLTVTGAMLSSFILAFVSDLSGLGNAFGGGLGGECGESVVKWASVVFGNILTGFMLAFLVIVWLVLASGKFSDWLMSLGKKPVAEPVVRQGSPTAEVTDNGKGVSTIDATSPVAEPVEATDKGRRAFLVGGAAVIGGSLLSSIPMRAEEEEIKDKKRDGGFAEVLPKKAPNRKTPVTPFGSESVEKFYKHCTACQLCVTVCPNNVLRPSSRLEHLMQPEMSFEKGYCRPECVKCSEVCPAGAILKITPEEKTEWKVGTAGVDYDLCVVNRDGVSCGNCARHCPVGAIRMVRKNPDDEKSPRIPSVNEEKCIGCGACENLCPSRPISAITVNGYSVHHNV